MALSGSPTNYGNGYEEDPFFQKSHYTQDISEQMRVPKRIRANGVFDDFDLPLGNGGSNHWNYQDKIDMTVPDRIVVMGQDQHLGKYSIISSFCLIIILIMSPIIKKNKNQLQVLEQLHGKFN